MITKMRGNSRGSDEEEMARRMFKAWLRKFLPGIPVRSRHTDTAGRQSAADYRFRIGAARFHVEVTGVHEKLRVDAELVLAGNADASLQRLVDQIKVSAEREGILNGYFVVTGDRAIPGFDRKGRDRILARALDYMRLTRERLAACEETLIGSGETWELKIVKAPIPTKGVGHSSMQICWEQRVLNSLKQAVRESIEKKAAAAQKRGGPHVLLLVNRNRIAEQGHFQRIASALRDVQALSAFRAVFLCSGKGFGPLHPDKKPNEGWPAFFCV
jgi:hypothetical protein